MKKYAKIVTESPRWGHDHKSRGVEQIRGLDPENDYEELAKFESNSANPADDIHGAKPHGHTKEFTDHIKPLERWLVKQVGRPWNKVYSELRASFPPTSKQAVHLYSHIWGFITKDVVIRQEGKRKVVYDKHAMKGWDTLNTLHPGQLYIHPTTGLLCKVRGVVRKWWRANRKPVYSKNGYLLLTRHPFFEGQEIFGHNGPDPKEVWEQGTLLKVDDDTYIEKHANNWILRRYSREIKSIFRSYTIISQKVLNKRELKQYGLR